MLALLTRSSWILTLRGLVAFFYALVAFFWSSATPIILMILLSMYAFVDGILSVVAAFENKDEHRQLAVLLPMGMVGITAGLVALFWPEPNPIEFSYLIAVWALVAGILEAVAGFRMHKLIGTCWCMTLKGGAQAIFGLVLIAWSEAEILGTNYWVGLSIALLGALTIVAAFRFGEWRDGAIPQAR
jgi:uncharacterized membrane protein HdeD (DUF308 family)